MHSLGRKLYPTHNTQSLTLGGKGMKQYLAVSKYVDWDAPEIRYLAKSLSAGVSAKEAIAKVCFEWVRDNIRHSSDYKLNPVTCKASDVLQYKTGYCYAKSGSFEK